MVKYEKIVEKAIKKEMEVLGEEDALEVAHEIEGIQVSDEGEVVELEKDGKDVLADLVSAYQEIGGSVTASLIAREIESDVDDDINLPKVLAKRIRAEKFASAL